jgi:hypothetical protein
MTVRPKMTDRERAQLPLVFERKFRPWRYGVSHSELSIRSSGGEVDGEPAADFVDITFHGVVGMKLRSVYQGITLTRAERPAADEMLRFAGVADSSQAHRVQCLTLDPEGDSFVACMRFSVWSHPRGGEYDTSGEPGDGSTLVLRE